MRMFQSECCIPSPPQILIPPTPLPTAYMEQMQVHLISILLQVLSRGKRLQTLRLRAVTHLVSLQPIMALEISLAQTLIHFQSTT